MDIPSSVLKSMDKLHHIKLYIRESVYLYIEQKKDIERATNLVVENNELQFLVPLLINWKKRVAVVRKILKCAIAFYKNAKKELQKKLEAGDEIGFNNASEDNNLLESKTDDVAIGAGEDPPLGDDFNLAETDD